MIDKNPQVGRYLLKDTILIHGFTHCGGKITKIAGKRIYFDREQKNGDIEPEYVSKFAAICDTREEMQMLLDHSQRCMDEHRDQMRRNKAEWEAFFMKGVKA